MLDEQPRARAADLAGIGEHGHRSTGHGLFEIGVREHDVRRFAAEFERHALQVSGRRPDDGLAGDMRAGERDLVDAGMRGKGCARGLAIARHHIDDAGRNAGFHHSSASRSEVSGASSAGLRITVQPVAIAGPIFQTLAPSGPFHGMIAPTTPIGSFRV